ncbi:hypothetical protein BHM03_00004806 [Ensete ventricosum]|nr:hypothetical protein BHM03_00004806 [Ensete ventricosum]
MDSRGEEAGVNLADGRRPDIHELFCHYDALYFRNALGACALYWASSFPYPRIHCVRSDCLPQAVFLYFSPLGIPKQAAMSYGNRKPHFVLVPLFAQGHMIPMIDLARLLALRGVVVSVVTTPSNTARFKATIDRANAAGLLIRFAELRFPCAEVGLSEGCENVDLIPSMELVKNFFAGLDMLREPLLVYLRQQWPKPSCIISDLCTPWTREVARELRVPRLVFHGPSCFFLLCTHNVSKHKSDGHVADAFEPFLVPGFPHKLEVVTAQSIKFFDHPGWEKLHDEAVEAETSADGLVINSFRELEAAYIDSYQKAMEKKVWAIGPVCLSNDETGDKVARGNNMNVDENHVRNWLDARETGSVIYVSFGSIATHSPSHLIEIGLGLEASKRPFIWVIKEKEMSPEEVASWLSEGFEERTSSRGLMLRGWAPQLLILSHPSVGGFMTHCGWNSTVEAVSAGVPMITWPHFADQFLNEKLVVEVLRIGVALKMNTSISRIADDSEGLITGEDVEKAVAELLGGGAEAEERRKRAKELGEKAKKAMVGGPSCEDLTLMIRHVVELADEASDAQELLKPVMLLPREG